MCDSQLHAVVRFAAAFPLAVLLFAIPGAVSALPPTQSGSDAVDDALIELTVLDQHITGDTRSWCQVRINVVGSDVSFTAGDRIYLWVYEDDVVGDDELWMTSFDVTAAEVTAQLVARTFDCHADFGSDGTPTLEVYASARVEKSECGAFCAWDRPQTANLLLSEIADDSVEDDDTTGTAIALRSGSPASRIAVDTDMHEITLTSPSIIDLLAFYRPDSGRIDVELLDSSSSLVLAATDQPTGGALTSAALGAGTFYVRVTPRAPPDSQFYDLLATISSASCASGATEMRSCEMCGMETRTCTGGAWGAWGACMMQGECAADAMETRACGGGGIETRLCSSTCAWGEYATCTGMSTDDDAGMATLDAAVMPLEDGGGRRDAAMMPLDDGGGGRDASGAGVTTDAGCSCRSTGGRGAAPLPMIVAALLGTLMVARRRRRRRLDV